MLHIIDRYLQKHWSPEIISNILRIEHGIKFSHTSIYTLIKKHRSEWAKHLAMKCKKPQKRYKDKYKGTLKNRIHISESPKEANERVRFGDIEADTVVLAREDKTCLCVAKVFSCRPYCSHDKGSIENRNKILRQFLGKETNFDLISNEQICTIHNKINNRPMKLLNWTSPTQSISK